MATNSVQKRLPVLDTLLSPIQQIIRDLLPEFIQRDLKSRQFVT
jgi:hypothetical protein